MGNPDRWRDFYEANKKRVNAQRRARYRKDPSVRLRKRVRAKVETMRKKDQRIHETRERLKAQMGSINELNDDDIRNVRLVLIDGELRRVYASNAVARVLGMDDWSLKRWIKRGIMVPPSFEDDKKQPWYTRDAVVFMKEAIIEYRPVHYKLEDFAQVVQHHWSKKNGR